MDSIVHSSGPKIYNKRDGVCVSVQIHDDSDNIAGVIDCIRICVPPIPYVISNALVRMCALKGLACRAGVTPASPRMPRTARARRSRHLRITIVAAPVLFAPNLLDAKVDKTYDVGGTNSCPLPHPNLWKERVCKHANINQSQMVGVHFKACAGASHAVDALCTLPYLLCDLVSRRPPRPLTLALHLQSTT